MFTGIISSMGTVGTMIRTSAGLRLTMDVDFDLDDVEIGASISHAGCCLTVVSKQGRSYDLDVSNETLSLTSLGRWQEGSKVNIERALKVGGRLFAVAGIGPAMEARLIERRGSSEFQRTTLFETSLETMEHSPRPEPFQF